MSSFDWRKNIEDSIKDGLIVTATTTGTFFALKSSNVKPPKASIDAMDIIELAGGIHGGILVKYYVVYKKWINDCLATQKYKNFMVPGGYKITIYFSIVKLPLGSLTAKWATASSRLNARHVRSSLLLSASFSI